MAQLIKADVAIIGAGISGLATAHFLAQKGLSVQLLEKADRAGGSIRTEHRDGFIVEHGPSSTLDTSPLLRQLFEELGIADQMEYANDASSNRYIVRGGKLHALPMGPFSFLKTKLFSTAAKFRLMKEPFIRKLAGDEDESLAHFVERRLGREFLDYAIDPFVAGVYAGKPEELSVVSGFAKLYALEQNYGSILKGAVLGARKRRKLKETSKQSAKLVSFRNGMGTMIDALVKEFGDALHLSTATQSIEKTEAGYVVNARTDAEDWQLQAEHLILAVPTHAYEHLHFSFDVPVLPEMSTIEYPPVSVVFLGYRKPPTARALDGFGFLIPQKENRNVLGAIWSSIIFPGRAPEGGAALTVFVGGSRQPANALLPHDELVDIVKKDLHELMGVNVDPDVVVIHTWEKAIPQYTLGYQKKLDGVEAFEKQTPGLHFSGNFRGGISVGDCIKQAHGLSERIVEGSRT